MKKYCLLLSAIFFLFISSQSQPITKATNNAFLITRMAEKFHVQPRRLDAAFSNDLYNNLLKELDEDRIFFTQEDINHLQLYHYTLNEQIAGRKTDFLQLLISIYNDRIKQADTMIANICQKPFNFYITQKITVAEDSSWPMNVAAMRLKIYKTIKLEVLNKLLDAKENEPDGADMPKKYMDSLEVVYRHKEERRWRRHINIVLQSPGGLQQDVCNIYCEKIATCYDPHTEFFPETEKENFESEVGNTTYEFGLGIGSDDDEENKSNGVTITSLKPGSPAYKSGFLNKGDKIMSLQWEGKDSIDVSDASTREISNILSESNHTKLTVVVKKEDNTTRHVTLVKEKEEIDDDRVKSFLLKGNQTVGYIRLPGFYSDWEDEKEDNGCANDVAKEIIKLKQENINGLIIDLRYNGGGSLEEAIALAGIFIDAGPVGQLKDNDNKTEVLKDMMRGTIYDGPLIIMVNGYSASASEMVAGTLQDYNRAVIVGTPTYGKATAQVVLPLDTTINIHVNNETKQADSYLKLTMNKLYRVSGATAQFSGVQPDILLPDLLQVNGERESKDPDALHIAATDANKYYKPYAPLPIASLKAIADKDIAADNYFSNLSEYKTQYENDNKPKDISLLWTDAVKENEDEETNSHELKQSRDSAKQYKVEDNKYEQQLLQTDEDLKEGDDEFKSSLSHDPYIKISYDLISGMEK